MISLRHVQYPLIPCYLVSSGDVSSFFSASLSSDSSSGSSSSSPDPDVSSEASEASEAALDSAFSAGGARFPAMLADSSPAFDVPLVGLWSTCPGAAFSSLPLGGFRLVVGAAFAAAFAASFALPSFCFVVVVAATVLFVGVLVVGVLVVAVLVAAGLAVASLVVDVLVDIGFDVDVVVAVLVVAVLAVAVLVVAVLVVAVLVVAVLAVAVLVVVVLVAGLSFFSVAVFSSSSSFLLASPPLLLVPSFLAPWTLARKASRRTCFAFDAASSAMLRTGSSAEPAGFLASAFLAVAAANFFSGMGGAAGAARGAFCPAAEAAAAAPAAAAAAAGPVIVVGVWGAFFLNGFGGGSAPLAGIVNSS